MNYFWWFIVLTLVWLMWPKKKHVVKSEVDHFECMVKPVVCGKDGCQCDTNGNPLPNSIKKCNCK